ncbi:MAG TPA: hypothetical protein VMZ92_02305 [Planctomycetota bacterium]|nr:hypothetical protein [Planctomycetota bacterium]
MTHRRRMVLSWVSLIAVGVLSMVFWRVELYHHGWEGLKWVKYSHRAVPVGTGMFIVWVIVVNGSLALRRRILLALALFFASVFGYYRTGDALYLLFYPRATLLVPPWAQIPLRCAAVAWLGLVPVLCSGVGWVSGVRPTWRRTLASEVVYLLSAPAAMGLLWVTKHRGGADFVHTIKSGFVIPFLVVALGILFLPRRPAPAAHDNCLNDDAKDADIG